MTTPVPLTGDIGEGGGAVGKIGKGGEEKWRTGERGDKGRMNEVERMKEGRKEGNGEEVMTKY